MNSPSNQNFVDAAFSKSGSSGLYDRARPTYPLAAIRRILSHLPKQNAKVVELGAGTGIFSRGLISNSEPGQISRWYALEPASGMREAFMGWAQSTDFFKDGEGPVISCTHGTFDRMESIESTSVDMVLAAQAWHWTGDDANFQETCVKEVERVLKPGGYFVLIWNLKDREASDWVGAIRDAYEIHESGTPQYRLGLWKTLFQTPTFGQSFHLLQPDESPNIDDEKEPKGRVRNVDDSIDRSTPTMTICTRVPMTLEGLFERILSKSYITALDTQSQELLRSKLRSVWTQHDSSSIERIDEQTVMFPYVTHVYIMQRK